MRKKVRSYTFAPKVKGERAKPERKTYVAYEEFKSGRKPELPADQSFMLVLIEKGAGTYAVESKEYRVKPRQIQLLIPGKPIRWKLQPGTKGQALIIKKALVETFTATLQFLFSDYNQRPVLDLDVATYKKINTEFLAIKKELSSTTVFMELVNARCRLVALMLTLWTEHKFGKTASDGNNSKSVAYKFHSLIEKHFKTQKQVLFYAKHLCITPNYLGVICRKQYGMSALELIQERVLLEAKRLLHSSDRSIKEIAFDLGFRNQTYFSYFFKSKTSLTPKEYKSLLEKS